MRRKKQDSEGEEKNRIEKEKKKTGLRRRRHSGDTKTHEHKDTGGTQRHRRDIKTQEGRGLYSSFNWSNQGN